LDSTVELSGSHQFYFNFFIYRSSIHIY
jgi:hypothetical protein